MARPRKFDRDEALEQAMLVFWRKGYEATYLDDLTEAMGINRPSLYNAFGDKETLYMEALGRYRELHGGKMLAALRGTSFVKAGFRRIFDDLVRESVEGCCRGCMIVNSTVEGCILGAPVTEFVKETDAASKRAFASALSEAQQKGELSVDKDPEALAAYLYSAVQGLQVRAKAGDDRKSLEAVTDLALSVLD